MKLTLENLLEIIKDAGTLTDVNLLKPDITLKDQKIDSLDMANILLNLQEKYNVNIPTEDINKLETLNAILNYINNKK